MNGLLRARHLVRLTVLLSLVACHSMEKPGTGVSKPAERKLQMTKGPFALTDYDFWIDPLKNSGKLSSEYGMNFKRMLLIDGPQIVDLSKRQSLPVPVWYFTSQTETAKFAFEDLAVVVAVSQSDRKVYASLATEPSSAPREPNSTPPNPDVWFGSNEVLDLKTLPGIPWQPNTFLVNVIVRDLISNRVTVQLADESRKSTGSTTPAPMPQSGVFPPPGNPYPSYQKDIASPAIPDAPGIALHANPRFDIVPGRQALVFASFRIEPRAFERLPPPKANDPRTVADAIIPITLVVIGTANSSPLSFTVRSPAKISGSQEVAGHFSLDLLQIPGFASRPQTYYIYAFAGEIMSGPVSIEFSKP